MKTLVIIPAFNEQQNIGSLLDKLKEIIDIDLDVLVINDHSKDKTSEICFSKGVKVVDLPCNLGIGGAVQTGYLFAKKHMYDFAIQVDGDGQHNPEFISILLKPLLNGEADMVIGSRYIEKKGFQSTLLRRVGINYFKKIIRMFTGQIITDPTSGFRACNLKVITLFAENYPDDYPEPESIIFLSRNKLKIKEVPVVMQERLGGKSSINYYKSIYYMIKVTLAIIIDTFRGRSVDISEVVANDIY